MQRERDGLLDAVLRPRLEQARGRGARAAGVHGAAILKLVSVVLCLCLAGAAVVWFLCGLLTTAVHDTRYHTPLSDFRSSITPHEEGFTAEKGVSPEEG